jgi:iron(III) transport system substrate-binding protein
MMKQKKNLVAATMLAGTMTALSFMSAGAAQAQGALVMYCGVQEEWCRAMTTAFERETGIKVSMTRKSAGEVYAQVKAESANPRADIWWGGTGDPHMQAAEEGLTQEYKSPKMGELQDWAVRQWEQSKNRTVGIYSGALGFGYNTDLVKSNNVPEPKCWADLLKAELKDEVQVADPNSSGTAYTLLATIVQLMGEDKGFEYLKALHKNINQYTKSGAAPAKAMALGETTAGIAFMHDIMTMVADKAPIKIVAPCEGTGYEIGSMSIIKGAKNLESAQKFYDWALTPAAQKLGAETKQFQVPSNKSTPIPPEAPKLSEMKLINFDFAKYGSSSERKRLLTKWDSEVKNLPK